MYLILISMILYFMSENISIVGLQLLSICNLHKIKKGE